MKTTTFPALIAISCLLACPLLAQTPAAASSPPPEGMAMPSEKQMETTVLSKMHHVNQMEIKAGQMAMEKGQSSDVRAYGRRLQNDHQFADSKVTELAKAEGIQLMEPAPTAPEEKQQAQKEKQMMEKLQMTQGAEFDTAFLKAMSSSTA